MKKFNLKKFLKKEELKMVKKVLPQLSVVSPKRLEECKNRIWTRLVEIKAPKCILELTKNSTPHDLISQTYGDLKILKTNDKGATFYVMGSRSFVEESLDISVADRIAAFNPQYRYEVAYGKVRGRYIWAGRLTLKEDAKCA